MIEAEVGQSDGMHAAQGRLGHLAIVLARAALKGPAWFRTFCNVFAERWRLGALQNLLSFLRVARCRFKRQLAQSVVVPADSCEAGQK